MSDTAMIIVLAAIGIGIGFFIGMLISNLRSTKESASQGNRSQDFQIDMDSMGAPDDGDSTAVNAKYIQDSVSAAEAGVQKKKRVQLNPIDIFTRAIQPNVESLNPYARSISEQIDEILQEMLERASLKSHAIRLMELPSKGMVVMVGLDQYQDVDAIPDEKVRNIIHAAVAEWERRVTEEVQVQEVTET